MQISSSTLLGLNGGIEVDSLLPHLLRMEAPETSPRTPCALPPQSPSRLKSSPSPSPPPPPHSSSNFSQSNHHHHLAINNNNNNLPRYYQERSRSPSPRYHRRSPSPNYPPAKRLKTIEADLRGSEEKFEYTDQRGTFETSSFDVLFSCYH